MGKAPSQMLMTFVFNILVLLQQLLKRGGKENKRKRKEERAENEDVYLKEKISIFIQPEKIEIFVTTESKLKM